MTWTATIAGHANSEADEQAAADSLRAAAADAGATSCWFSGQHIGQQQLAGADQPAADQASADEPATADQPATVADQTGADQPAATADDGS